MRLFLMPLLLVVAVAGGFVMLAYFTENGTYTGATMPNGTGPVIVQADPTTFCLQYQAESTVMHLDGPNGTAISGAC
jgi:hypothetical protein